MSAWDSWRRALLAMTAASALTTAGEPVLAAGAPAPYLKRPAVGYRVEVGSLDYRICVSKGLQ